MKNIIGYLMFLANGEGIKSGWYPLKQKLCDRYGANDGYDIQYLEGKECYACNGTGVFIKYAGFGSSYPEPCYKCYKGWYKQPAYVLLERIKVGNHVFHKPIQRVTNLKTLLELDVPKTITIDGYINHNRRKYGWLAFTILNIIFNFKEYRKYIKNMGVGWAVYWWLPKNWINNYMHLKRNGWDSIPLMKIKKRFRFMRKQPIEDLPF